MMISIPSAVGLGVLAGPIMELLFPQRATFALAVRLLQIGCISVVFYALSTITNGVLQGIGKVNVPLKNAVLSLVLMWSFSVDCCFLLRWNLMALIISTMLYALLMCYLNSRSVKKYLGYRQELRKTFLIPAVSALIMGVFCYVFYEGIYLILHGMLGGLLPVRLVVLLCLLMAVAFGAGVFFVVLIKLGGVNEKELKNFPKGYKLVHYAKQYHLL